MKVSLIHGDRLLDDTASIIGASKTVRTFLKSGCPRKRSTLAHVTQCLITSHTIPGTVLSHSVVSSSASVPGVSYSCAFSCESHVLVLYIAYTNRYCFKHSAKVEFCEFREANFTIRRVILKRRVVLPQCTIPSPFVNAFSIIFTHKSPPAPGRYYGQQHSSLGSLYTVV